MSGQPDRLDAQGAQRDAVMPRLFLREPGWRVAVKTDSQREFCYTASPGQDHYHRLAAGEVYFHRGDEKICIPCADRYGLIEFAPVPLRETLAQTRFESEGPETFDLA